MAVTDNVPTKFELYRMNHLDANILLTFDSIDFNDNNIFVFLQKKIINAIFTNISVLYVKVTYTARTKLKISQMYRSEACTFLINLVHKLP